MVTPSHARSQKTLLLIVTDSFTAPDLTNLLSNVCDMFRNYLWKKTKPKQRNKTKQKPNQTKKTPPNKKPQNQNTKTTPNKKNPLSQSALTTHAQSPAEI